MEGNMKRPVPFIAHAPLLNKYTGHETPGTRTSGLQKHPSPCVMPQLHIKTDQF